MAKNSTLSTEGDCGTSLERIKYETEKRKTPSTPKTPPKKAPDKKPNDKPKK